MKIKLKRLLESPTRVFEVKKYQFNTTGWGATTSNFNFNNADLIITSTTFLHLLPLG